MWNTFKQIGSFITGDIGSRFSAVIRATTSFDPAQLALAGPGPQGLQFDPAQLALGGPQGPPGRAARPGLCASSSRTIACVCRPAPRGSTSRSSARRWRGRFRALELDDLVSEISTARTFSISATSAGQPQCPTPWRPCRSSRLVSSNTRRGLLRTFPRTSPDVPRPTASLDWHKRE